MFMSFIKFSTFRKERAGVLFIAAGLSAVLFGTTVEAATINTSLAVGSRGAEVIVLQTYLAQESELYPEKFVTGYFGPLTEAAVKRFQCREDIVCEEEVTSGTTTNTTSGYGRVGPRTKARLNELLVGMTLTTPSGEVLGASTGTGTGSVSGALDLSAPIMSAEQTTVGSTFGTISWATNEPAWSRVLYSTTYPFLLLTAENVKDPSFDTTNGVSIGNLQPNTTYYYVRESADVANNVSLSGVKSLTTGALGSVLPGSVGTSTMGTTGTTTAATSTSTTTNLSTGTSSSAVATTTTATNASLQSSTTTSTTTIGY